MDVGPARQPLSPLVFQVGAEPHFPRLERFPTPAQEPGWLKARPRRRVCCRILGEIQAGLCEQPGACLDQGSLNRKNFSKRKRENRGTQQIENSPQQPRPLAPLPPQPLDCERGKAAPALT